MRNFSLAATFILLTSSAHAATVKNMKFLEEVVEKYSQQYCEKKLTAKVRVKDWSIHDDGHLLRFEGVARLMVRAPDKYGDYDFTIILKEGMSFDDDGVFFAPEVYGIAGVGSNLFYRGGTIAKTELKCSFFEGGYADFGRSSYTNVKVRVPLSR